MILFVDPGDTSGLALFTDKGTETQRWQADFRTLCTDLTYLQKLDRIVVEDYRLQRGKQAQQTGSRFQAVQVIGALKYHAHMYDAEFNLVNNQAKTLGAMYSGEKQPSDHSKSHQVDAYNIGIYWLVKNNVIAPPSLATL